MQSIIASHYKTVLSQSYQGNFCDRWDWCRTPFQILRRNQGSSCNRQITGGAGSAKLTLSTLNSNKDRVLKM